MTNSTIEEIILFNIANISCALDIRKILEIKRLEDITIVYGAPSVVEGVINLRGEIVTVLNIRKIFGNNSQTPTGYERIMIISSGKEKVGLLVDLIDDVILFDPEAVLPTPPNIDEGISRFIDSVYQWNDLIISLIDLETIISVDNLEINTLAGV